jgi:hypothetical protein
MNRRRWLLLLGLALIALVASPISRDAGLRALGHALVAEERHLDHVDLIIIAVDAGGEGVLEAADLVRGGASATVAVIATPPDAVDLEFRRRGVPEEDDEAHFLRQLRELGIVNTISLPHAVGTEDQGRVIRNLCEKRGLSSALIVTSWHHSRRVDRTLRRAIDGCAMTFAVHPSRYSDESPDNWWTTREGARVVIVELQKLLWDVVRHPLT